MTTDENITARIEALVAEEHDLRRREQADTGDDEKPIVTELVRVARPLRTSR
jgi:hypothetical protein